MNAFASSTLLLFVILFPGAFLGCSVDAALDFGSAAAFGRFSGDLGLLGDCRCGLQVRVVVLLAAQLAADGVWFQHALLMGLAEGVGT